MLSKGYLKGVVRPWDGYTASDFYRKHNEKGEFVIRLELKKDEQFTGIQIDNYVINASVTDVNGETQSAENTSFISSALM